MTANRRNRRATTDGRPVTDNRIHGVRTLVDGFGDGTRRLFALHYRRHLADGRIYTGEVQR